MNWRPSLPPCLGERGPRPDGAEPRARRLVHVRLRQREAQPGLRPEGSTTAFDFAPKGVDNITRRQINLRCVTKRKVCFETTLPLGRLGKSHLNEPIQCCSYI